MTISFLALDKWPYADAPARKGYAYKADYGTIVADLAADLAALDATDITLSMSLTRKDIRRDGWPVAGARPPHPGVILTAYTNAGPLEFACDENARWQHNLRAISLTLEALRAVERHGATKRRQQYAGYLAAPPPPDAIDQQKVKKDAWAFLARQSGFPVAVMQADPKALEAGKRAAQKACHPDGRGSGDMFLRLTAALEALGLA